MRDSGTKLIFAACLLGIGLLTFFRPEGAKPANPNATVISLSFWGTYEEWTMWREIKAAFEAKNPDVFVKLNFIPGNYDDKVRLLLAADTAPDVMLLQDEPFPAYAHYGKFADLTERVRGPKAPQNWESQFWPTTVESFTYNDRIMALPIWGGNVLVFYNRKMFKDLGVEPPSDNWTFDDFIAKAQALTRDTNGDRRPDTFGFLLPHWIYYLPFNWGFDADYLNEDRTDWTFEGPKAVEATRFFQDMLFKYRIAPSIQDVPLDQQPMMFMTGRIGMLVGGPWSAITLITAGTDFDVVHMPVGPAGQRFTRVSWDGLAMSARSPHKEEAWRFMAFCLGMEAQSIVGKSMRSLPVLVAAKSSYLQPDNGWQEEKFVEALEYSRVQPITLHWEKMRQVMDSTYEQLLLDKLTPEETVARLNKRMKDEKVFPLGAEP